MIGFLKLLASMPSIGVIIGLWGDFIHSLWSGSYMFLASALFWNCQISVSTPVYIMTGSSPGSIVAELVQQPLMSQGSVGLRA